jgi:predicted transcriptional regulator
LFKENEFKAEVVRNGLTMKQVADALNIDVASLYRKISGTSDFYRGEISALIKILHLDDEAIMRIFFAT